MSPGHSAEQVGTVLAQPARSPLPAPHHHVHPVRDPDGLESVGAAGLDVHEVVGRHFDAVVVEQDGPSPCDREDQRALGIGRDRHVGARLQHRMPHLESPPPPPPPPLPPPTAHPHPTPPPPPRGTL